MQTEAILLAGGTGSRVGGTIPKQYIDICGKPMIFYTLQKLLMYSKILKIRIVAEEQWHGVVFDCIEQLSGMEKFAGFSLPGENRQLSIRNALVDMHQENDTVKERYVLIHDAARPFVNAKLLDNLMNAMAEGDGVLPVLPMKDTVYYSEDGKCVTGLLERSKLLAGQTPELFEYTKYYAANMSLSQDQIMQINGSTEPAIRGGMKIVFVPGDEENFKVTTKADLERAESILKQEIV